MAVYDNLTSRFPDQGAWPEENENAILEPFNYITSVPGKDIRGHLIEAFNIWLQVPPDKLKVIAEIVSMLHNASLLVDDIQDDAQSRRGIPVAHKIYGVPQTINTANYVYFQAFEKLAILESGQRGASDSPANRPSITSIVTSEMLNLHRGQGLDILWRDTLHCPTEEEYISMVSNKTGGLPRLGVKVMMACATSNLDVDYTPLVNLIGIHFQIRDDLMNLQSEDYAKNKGFAEDLTEGKFSFPVVHSIHADKNNRQVINILAKRPSSPSIKHSAISYMKNKTKTFEYTLAVLDNIENQIRAEIARLGGNTSLERLMDRLRVTPDMI